MASTITEIGRIIELALRMRNIRHLEIHTITYTGQAAPASTPSGAGASRRMRCCAASKRRRLACCGRAISCRRRALIRCATRLPYLLIDPDGGPAIPFTRLMPRETLYAALSDRLSAEPTPSS